MAETAWPVRPKGLSSRPVTQKVSQLSGQLTSVAVTNAVQRVPPVRLWVQSRTALLLPAQSYGHVSCSGQRGVKGDDRSPSGPMLGQPV